MALKCLNTQKRKGFWLSYDRANLYSIQQLYKLVHQCIDELGCPFQRKGRGRPPKLELEEYAKISILLTYFNLSLRKMEGLLPFLVSDSLDHSNIDRWFQKLDSEFISESIRWLNAKTTAINANGSYIADSTGFTTDRYEQRIFRGKIELHLSTLKLHVVVIYLLDLGLVSIVDAHVTGGRAHDSPALRKMLARSTFMLNKLLNADKAYDCEATFEMCFKLGLQPNIVFRKNTKKGFYRKKAKIVYNDALRKAMRGLVETVFGGMETETGNRVRFRLKSARVNWLLLQAFKHNVRTYLRATVVALFDLCDNLRAGKRLIN